MTTGAIVFMALSWTFVLGLTIWSFWRVLQKQRKLALFLALMVLPALGGQAPLAASAQDAPAAQAAPAVQAEHRPGGGATLVLPDLDAATVGGYDSRALW